jgi:Flp pilus assembly protein TadG
MKTMLSIMLRIRRSVADFAGDCRGIAATEFAVIVPIMLVMFFGTVEISSGVAVDRKVTLMARTLSDLTSQSLSVADTDLTNFFNASKGIMTPYTGSPSSTITELYVDPNTLAARVQWSQGSAPRATSSTVSIPTTLKVGGTYLIFSEVSYTYVPTIGYVMAKSGITMNDVAYTRPRQSLCVFYPTPASGPLPSSCPVL